ncbi:NADH-ubiquinone oxidoreductase Complex1 subunit [Clavulina sp. PMI_390]|nr:NADH-ubiquinone oxidoreductase Complex1 subunit [Clavulina sp. PMI_390]
MTTIPSRLAKVSLGGSSLPEVRARSRALYREWYRNAPLVCEIYALNVPASLIRTRIREQFELNSHIQDPAVLDVLLHKGRVDLQETLNVWKQEPHILGVLLAPKRREERTFMQKFIEGRDENAVLPASPQVSSP